MNQEQERKLKQDLVNSARDLLKDGAFDAVVVIASWQTEDGFTAAVHSCDGNWYAQNGMITHLVKRREQSAVFEGNEQAQRDSERDNE